MGADARGQGPCAHWQGAELANQEGPEAGPQERDLQALSAGRGGHTPQDRSLVGCQGERGNPGLASGQLGTWDWGQGRFLLHVLNLRFLQAFGEDTPKTVGCLGRELMRE